MSFMKRSHSSPSTHSRLATILSSSPSGRRQAWVIALSLLLLWGTLAHVLEDFVYGIPARFGVSVATGAAWACAAAIDHLGEILTVWPYREGVISKVLEVGIIVVGAALAGVSLAA